VGLPSVASAAAPDLRQPLRALPLRPLARPRARPLLTGISPVVHSKTRKGLKIKGKSAGYYTKSDRKDKSFSKYNLFSEQCGGAMLGTYIYEILRFNLYREKGERRMKDNQYGHYERNAIERRVRLRRI